MSLSTVLKNLASAAREEHQDALSLKEKQKLRYLLDCYLALYDSWVHHKSDHSESLEELADEAGWWFDWEPVIRECMPDVLVIMSGDRRSVPRFPSYAAVPRVGEWFEIGSNPPQLEALRLVAVPVDGDINTVTVLESLRRDVVNLPADRRGDAMKHYNALRRIITPTV